MVVARYPGHVHGAAVAAVNTEVLIWARETAGLDLETAARKIGLNPSRGISGAERLSALERGDGAPTTLQLRKMAQHYHRPLLTFYMPKVPAPAELGQDFRTLPDRGDPSNVLLAKRNCAECIEQRADGRFDTHDHLTSLSDGIVDVQDGIGLARHAVAVEIETALRERSVGAVVRLAVQVQRGKLFACQFRARLDSVV